MITPRSLYGMKFHAKNEPKTKPQTTYSIMKKTIITAAVFAAGIFAPLSAATTIYDIGTNVGADGTLLSTDGWAGDDLSNWVVGTQAGTLYARNQNDGDNTITRTNDGGFSYSIPSGTTSMSLEMTGRFGVSFFQAGLSTGGTMTLGIGGDFNNSNKFFILDGGTRRNESGTSYSGDTIKTVRLDFDLVAGTADLILDPNGTPTTLISGQSIAASLDTADGIFIRSGSRYTGPATFTITTVPEPSSAALLGLGGLALILRRRK